MKYSKKREQYEAANVSLKLAQTMDGLKVSAFSYDWWQFVAVINGKVVFNGYNYSPTTCKHQSKVRAMLRTLDIEIDFTVYTKSSLDNVDALEDAIKFEVREIAEIELSLSSSRRKKALDEQRHSKIAEHKQRIEYIQRELMGMNRLQIALTEVSA